MATWRGGERFLQKIAALERTLAQPGKLQVGFMEGATYPNGSSVAEVAADNEYGNPAQGRPPRPFFRNMIAKHKDEWPDDMAKFLRQNRYAVSKTLHSLGSLMKEQLVDSIENFEGAPLSPSTVEKKGHDRPLIDTQHMLNSVTYRVKE